MRNKTPVAGLWILALSLVLLVPSADGETVQPDPQIPHARLDTPVLLNFDDVPLGSVLEAIGRVGGLDVRLDGIEADKRISITLDNMTLLEALDRLAQEHALEYEWTLVVRPKE